MSERRYIVSPDVSYEEYAEIEKSIIASESLVRMERARDEAYLAKVNAEVFAALREGRAL